MRRVYRAPETEMREFLANSLNKLTGFERLENEKFCKLLAEKHEGKCPFHSSAIGNTFSWLNQIGVISYEMKYFPSGGWRPLIFRSCDPSAINSLIMSGVDVEKSESPAKEVDCTFTPAEKPDTSKKKKKKACCDNPHVVKSKKTGKRRCKNCGTPYPDKKPSACAPEAKPKAKSCCDNPHPVKSRKTGKRRCKNCGTPLPPKK